MTKLGVLLFFVFFNILYILSNILIFKRELNTGLVVSSIIGSIIAVVLTLIIDKNTKKRN